MIKLTIPKVTPCDDGYLLTRETIVIDGNLVQYNERYCTFGYARSHLRMRYRSLRRAGVKEDSLYKVIRILRKLEKLEKYYTSPAK